MKRTYTGTWMMSNEKLQKATVRILVYSGNKYSDELTVDQIEEDMHEVKYTGLTAWDIIEGGEEAEEIEEKGLVDEHHEYLILHFNDGTEVTYRNSHVDMFLR